MITIELKFETAVEAEAAYAKINGVGLNTDALNIRFDTKEDEIAYNQILLNEGRIDIETFNVLNQAAEDD